MAGSPTLLVVEDHADTANTLARLLKASGYEVRVARTAAGALEIAEREPIHVLLSDVGLPDASGYDLIRRLRERQAIKAIAMSGYGTDDHIRKSREAGFSEHLVKPVTIEELEEAIERVLGEAG